MKRMTVKAVVIFAFTAFVILPLMQVDAVAREHGSGCKLQGTWVGEIPAFGTSFKFFATYQGTGDNEGTLEIDFIDVPVMAPKMATTARGTWAKTGPNTYEITYQAFFVERIVNEWVAVNQISFIGLFSGTVNLEECDGAAVNVTGYYFLPGDDTPIQGPETAAATMHRLLLHQAAPLPWFPGN